MLGIENVTEQLKKDEWLSLFSYKCPVVKLTIGYGRNIEDNGITSGEAEYLLKNDIERCYIQVYNSFKFFPELSDARQEVLINMCYNLGLSRLMSFKRMMTALTEGKYLRAADEMMDSKWARQVGIRAERLAAVMRGND